MGPWEKDVDEKIQDKGFTWSNLFILDDFW